LGGGQSDYAETTTSLAAVAPELGYTVSSRHLFDWLTLFAQAGISTPWVHAAYALAPLDVQPISYVGFSGFCGTVGGGLALESAPNEAHGNVGLAISVGRSFCSRGGLAAKSTRVLDPGAAKIDLDSFALDVQIFQRF
jgi:hypothetical protein